MKGTRRFPVMAAVMAAVFICMPGFTAPRPARAAPTANRYTIKNIGVLKGDTGSLAFAINAAGTAVAMSFNREKGTNRTAIFRDGKLRDATGGETRQSFAWAIDKQGRAVGFLRDTEQTATAAIWDGTKTTELPTLGDSAQAFGINDKGVVVGGSNLAPGGPVVACRWVDGKVAVLPSAGDGSLASAINNRGQIAGSGFGSHATLWEGDRATDLGVLGGATSLARSINEGGKIVGHSTTTADGTFGLAGTHAFIWDAGTMTDLGTLPGGQISFGWDINKGGVVVGTADNPTPPGDPTLADLAVIWQDGRIADLNGLIPAGSGWVLTFAYGINDAGQIVGFGYLKGKQRGFVLTPAPS